MADNPLPFLDPTHSALLRAVMREQSDASADKAVEKYARAQQAHCGTHLLRTTNLESVVFGRSETGFRGLDERMDAAEKRAKEIASFLDQWSDDRRALKRAVVAAVLSAAGSLLVAVIVLLVNLSTH